MTDIRIVHENEKNELMDFLIFVNGEDVRGLAGKYVDCMFSDDFRRPTFLTAVEDGKIVGAIAYSEELFTVGTWGISWVSVHPDKRNKGLGMDLIKSCLNEISKKAGKTVTVILATYPDKTGLYDKSGFVRGGKDHEGGFYMTKILEA